MKKLLLIFAISTIFSFKLLACSYTPISFCSTSKSELYNENLIVFGQIISIDNNGINFEIIDVLRGTENSTVIRIWDGVDFDCNGNFSMSASEIGNLNETLVIILPKISEKKSDWEVVGDYRRPDYFGYIQNLTVENGIISGLISGEATYPYVEEQTNYENFKSSWSTNQNCSSVVLKNEVYQTIEEFKILTLPDNKFKIATDNIRKNEIAIFNVFGLKIKSEVFFIREIEIDLSTYTSGIYFIHIKYENNKFKTLKVIKK